MAQRQVEIKIALSLRLGDFLEVDRWEGKYLQFYCYPAGGELTSACIYSSVQFSCSVVSDSCDPMNCSTPGLPVHHQLPEFTQTHVHRVGDAIQPSHPLLSPSPAPYRSQHQGLFQWVNSLLEVAKVLEFQLQHHCIYKFGPNKASEQNSNNEEAEAAACDFRLAVSVNQIHRVRKASDVGVWTWPHRTSLSLKSLIATKPVLSTRHKLLRQQGRGNHTKIRES